MQNDYSNVISQNAKSASQILSEFFVDNIFLEFGEHNFLTNNRHSNGKQIVN